MASNDKTPNPADYAILHLGVSGGKDSTAAYLWVVYVSGWPLDRVWVTFCDTGNEDLLTYAYLKMLSEHVFPIETIYPERDFWQLAHWKQRFPSRRARFCTQFLKVIPTRDHALDLMNQGEILLLTGVRSDEAHASNDRGELPKFGWDDGFACDIFRPILDWSLEDVWKIHKKFLPLEAVLGLIRNDPELTQEHKKEIISKIIEAGIPRNPLYDMGAKRVGCFPCMNSAKPEVRAIAKYRPRKIDFIDDEENSFENGNMFSGFFARNTVPLAHRSKEITTKAGEKMMVCTIHDVVRWSKTAYGGKQYNFDLHIPDTPSACDIGGMCE